MSHPNLKYRPVLTAPQINHLLSLCKKDLSIESLSCISVLAPFEYKIKHNAIEPAYQVTQIEKRSLTNELGFETVTVVSESGAQNLTNHPHDDEALYNKWMENPDELSVEQLKRVQFYRYQNGKMMPEEESKYERETLGV